MKGLPRLYAITDRRKYGPDFIKTLESILKHGIKMIQLREKDLHGKELYELASTVRQLTKSYGAMLFINSRPDVAVAVGADGVHLPENDVPPRAIKELFPELLVGRSTHSPESARKAQEEGADFVVFGPVFKTASHPTTKPAGLGALKKTCRDINIPVFALGGVTWEKAKACYKNGAYGIAGITMFIKWKQEN